MSAVTVEGIASLKSYLELVANKPSALVLADGWYNALKNLCGDLLNLNDDAATYTVSANELCARLLLPYMRQWNTLIETTLDAFRHIEGFLDVQSLVRDTLDALYLETEKAYKFRKALFDSRLEAGKTAGLKITQVAPSTYHDKGSVKIETSYLIALIWIPVNFDYEMKYDVSIYVYGPLGFRRTDQVYTWSMRDESLSELFTALRNLTQN